MPTSVPNLNFLAPIVTEIWRGPKIGAADLLRRALAGKLLHVAIKNLQMATSVPNFNFLGGLVSEI